MKKVKRIEIEIECVFTQEEAKTLFSALTYVKHRIEKHPESGARFISIDRVDKLLKDFES